MGSVGFPEMLVIVVVALVVFGPGKLPEIGSSLGRAIGEFKRAIHEEPSTPPNPEPAQQPEAAEPAVRDEAFPGNRAG